MRVSLIIILGITLSVLFISSAEATRVRVFYQADGRVAVEHPDQRMNEKPANMTNEEWISAQFLDAQQSKPCLHENCDLAQPVLPSTDMDDTLLPNGNDQRDRSDRNRWRGTKATGIIVDPAVILKKDLFQQIDDELAKPSPNAVAIARIRGKIRRREHE